MVSQGIPLAKGLFKAGLTLSIAFFVSAFPLTLSGDFSECVQAEARGRKKTPPASSRSRSGSTKTRASREKRREVKSSRSVRESRGGSRASRRERVSSHRDRHASRGGRASISAHRGRHHHGGHEHVPATVVKPPPPSPEQVEANTRRESAYQTMARAYRLYDEGINLRLAGDFGSAVTKLNESYRLFNVTRNYQRTGESSLQEALVHYELGQACEGQGDILSARDSYVRCLNIRPTMVDASIRLVSMLATAGQWQLAIAKAQDAIRTNPTDPRVRQLMALTLSKTGHAEEAKAEASKAQEMLKLVPKYKPMGIDAVWRRTHKEDGTPETGSESGLQRNAPDTETKSDIDNPDDVMGVEEEMDAEDD